MLQVLNMVEMIEKSVFDTDFRDEYCQADRFWDSNVQEQRLVFNEFEYETNRNDPNYSLM